MCTLHLYAVMPHFAMLDWVLKDDGFGGCVRNTPDYDAEVIRFLTEDLH